jgi:hypothetical protein
MSTSSVTSSTTSSSTLADMGSIPALAIFVAPYATINVKNHIPVTLELTKPNFNQWESFFNSLREIRSPSARRRHGGGQPH